MVLTRTVFGTATLGELDIDGEPFCYTLEDEVRVDPDPSTPQNEGKIYGKTAIPAGKYQLDITWSPKFQKMMIAVLDVPGFTGIRIHAGVDVDDTLGCILVGHTQTADTVHGGLQIMPMLFDLLSRSLNSGRSAWLEIREVAR